jgi:hypothetical protein
MASAAARIVDGRNLASEVDHAPPDEHGDGEIARQRIAAEGVRDGLDQILVTPSAVGSFVIAQVVGAEPAENLERFGA